MAAAYPRLAAWIGQGGRVELGRADDGRSMARALDASGVVWQGQESYSGLGELLQDLEAGLGTLVAD